MSNAIQQIATNMFYQWQSVNATVGMRWICLLIKPGDETMLDAFYHYMLEIDIDGEDMIFILQLPFRSIETFSQDVVAFGEEQVEVWNTSSKPEGTSFEKVDWKADDTLQDDDNPAQLAVENLNLLTSCILGAEKQKCSFVLHLSNYCEQKEIHQWISNALKLESHKQMTFTMGQVKGAELLKELERIPMVLLALTNSPHRTKYISEKELDTKLVDSLGPNWRDFLYEYKEKLKSPPQTTQEID